MGSILSFLIRPRLPKSIDRTTETEWNCPICRDARDDLAYVMPCLHQFCLACIIRWAEMQRVCPLCRELIEAVRFSVQTDSYIDCVFTSSEESANASSSTGITLGQLVKNSPFVESPSRAPRGILPTSEHEGTGAELVGGLLPRLWAELFQREEHLLDPVVPWLRQELEAKYGTRWWMARIAESIILHAVSICGPARNVLIHVLQDFLEEHTEPLINGLISMIVNECTQEAQRLIHFPLDSQNNLTAISSRFQMDTTSPHSTPASSDSEEHQSSTLEAVLDTLHPSAPTPAEQEELGEEAVAEEPGREEDNSTVAIFTSPQDDNPTPQEDTASIPVGSSTEDQANISEAVLHTLHLSAPTPADQEELGEEGVAEEPDREEDNSTVAIFTSPQEGNPAPQEDTASIPVGSSMEDQANISEAVLHTLHLSAPTPADQEEQELAAVAGPSDQGDSHSPSAPSQGRDPLPRRIQRSTRRRASSHLDSPQPRKMRPNQQK